MITLTIKRKGVVNKLTKFTTTIQTFKTTESARKVIKPIVIEMNKAEKNKTEPSVSILAVSYDLESERVFLVETGALKTSGGVFNGQ